MNTSDTRTDIRNRFLAVDTSNVADVLDERGLPNQGLHPSFRPESGERLAGWAYTIAGEMAAYEGGGDPLKMEACGGIGDEEISVWAGNGEGVCYFGELIALGMVERGSVGALVDGGVRDTRWLREHRFPVFARYHTPIQSIGRVESHPVASTCRPQRGDNGLGSGPAWRLRSRGRRRSTHNPASPRYGGTHS
jgi:4-hydroxy-4-methyl-2-oxoglutarate aldolase